MTRPTVRIGGALQGGGGGGGTCEPATAWNADWTPIYDRDFTALSDEDILPGGDGNVAIDGKTWYVRNVAKMITLDVGPMAGGLKIGLSPSAPASSWFNGTRTAPSLELEISELLDGTAFENRNDVEMRVRAKLAFPTPLSGSLAEVVSLGVETKTYDANQRFQIYQGGVSGNNDYRRVFTNFPGTLRRGDIDLIDSDLAYFPNVLGISLLENYVMSEYSDSDAGEVTDDLKTAAAFAHTAAIIASDPTDTKRHFLYLSYAKESGASLATYLTLEHLRIEARLSPRGVGVFVP